MSQLPAAATSTRTLARSLEAVRTHAWLVWLATTGFGVVGAAGLLLVAALLADQYLVLPAMMRLFVLVLIIGGPILVAWRAARARPGASLEQIALLVEKRHPQLDNLLINSLQLTDEAPGEAAVIVDALTRQAGLEMGHLGTRSAIGKRWLLLAAAATLAGAGFLFNQAQRDSWGAGLNRVLLPFGENTLARILEVDPGDLDVLINSDVDIVATIGGRIPTQAACQLIRDDGRRLEITLAARSEATLDRLVGRISRIEQDTRYRIIAGDAKSETFQIRVHERPVVEQIFQSITLPAYVHSEPIEKVGGNIVALIGSTVRLRVVASQPFSEAKLTLNGQPPQALARSKKLDEDDGATGFARLDVAQRGRYRLELVSAMGFAGEPVSYDITAVQDQTPQVAFVEPTKDLEVDIDATVVIKIHASDDFAIRQVMLVAAVQDQVTNAAALAQNAPLKTWTSEQRSDARVERQITLQVAELGLQEGKPITLQALAFDYRPDSDPGIADPITIRLKPVTSGTKAIKADLVKHVSLQALILAQRTNIAASQVLNRGESKTGAPGAQRSMSQVIDHQGRIRLDAVDMAKGEAAGNPAMQRLLENMTETIMVVAIEQLRTASTSKVPGNLGAAIATQQEILRSLITSEATQEGEAAEQIARQIAQMLAELIVKQKALRQDTADRSGSGGALGSRQRVLARRAALLQRQIKGQANTGASGNADLAKQYRQATTMFEQQEVRGNMILAVERLGDDNHDGAIEKQDQVLEALLAIQKLLTEQALDDAEEELEQLAKDLEDAKERVDKMTEIQESVTEIARQLNETKDRRDGIEDQVEQIEELSEVREDLAEAIEELIKDMHLFPPTDIGNDLLSEMSEIFEDIEQAAGSEDQEITEIAVDRDEGLLAALKEMQKKMGERLGDLEMWLPDTPDVIRWKQESYDRDEMGEIPLGDLPDELEDIVGDLADQAESLYEEAQDSASNVGLPDMTMGWDILDGPMPSWAAKGKSGNQKPNTNEQVGRSGSGRQGMSSGEVVGDTIKALEGSDVKTRRTDDPFQAGELMEEDPNFMDVKATGGGKQGGITYSEGMTGNSPGRDEMKYRKLERKQQMLKQNVESVFSKAKLLRLPTGELDRAMLELDAAQRRLEQGDLAGFLRSQQRVVRKLKQTHGQLSGEVVVQATDTARQSTQAAGATGEPIPVQYEDAVADYMRLIAE